MESNADHMIGHCITLRQRTRCPRQFDDDKRKLINCVAQVKNKKENSIFALNRLELWRKGYEAVKGMLIFVYSYIMNKILVCKS